MPARRARRIGVDQGRGQSDSTPSRHGPRREDRGAQLRRPARHGDDPAWPTPRGATSPTRRSSSATRSRSRSASIEATQPDAGVHRRGRHVRAGVHQRLGDDLRARLRQVAPPAPQPPQRHVPGHDALRRRAARSSARTASRPARSTRRRPSTRSSSRAWSPTSTSSTGSPRSRTASSASPTGKAFLQRRPQRRAAPCRRSPGARTCKSFKPRMSASQQHDKVRVTSYDPVTRKAIVGEATEPGSIPRAGARGARQGGERSAPSELLVSDRVANTADRGAHDRPEHARQARERLVRGRGHDGGRPRRQGRRQAQARGLRALRRRARRHVGHARLRPRRLPHALRDQRPQPAHADRRDAAEGRARLERRPRDRARDEHQGPRGRSAACA